MLRVNEAARVRHGALASDESFGCNGAFMFDNIDGTKVMQCIVTDSEGWEHVSMTIRERKSESPDKPWGYRLPTWTEMCQCKDLFWDKEDCVVQYHPPKSDYVNCHDYVLHLWRPKNTEIPRPPSYMVGPKNTEAQSTLEPI